MLDLAPEWQTELKQILARHIPNRAVWAFGSRVTGRARRWSDLDLLVWGDAPLDISTAAQLRNDLSESNLPIKIDLADAATFHPHLMADVQRHHAVIQ